VLQLQGLAPHGVTKDVLLTLRSMRRAPGFAATALITLILAIGATTAIFSVVYAVLLRPLPYPNAKALVHIVADDPGDSRSGVPYSLFEALQGKSRTLEDVAAYYRNTGWSRVTVGGQVDPEIVQAGFCTAGLFRVLGAKPALGRAFDDREVNGVQPVAVISAAVWKRRYAGRGDVLGQSIIVDGRPVTVVGVMPPEFQFPARETELWLPITTNRYWGERLARDNVHGRGFFMRWNLVARLRAGAPTTLAQEELSGLAKRLSAQDSAWNMGLPLKVVPLSIEIAGRVRLALLLLLGAVLLVLLIACGNVANLLLARGAARSRELAIRSSLGASPTRIVRQLLTESLVLVSIATAAALVVAHGAIRLLMRWGPADLPRLQEAKLDGAVFAFAVGMSLLTALLFGLWPALKAGWSGSSTGSSRAGRLLIAAEFAMAVVLATSAALFLRSLWETERVELGYRPTQVLAMRVQLPREIPLARRPVFEKQLQNRLKSLPGVERAGGIENLFELGQAPINSLRAVEGEPAEVDRERPLTWTVVSGEYFQAMGIPLLAGRFFSPHDGPNSALVAIIDASMATRYWPDGGAKGAAIGRRFKGQDRRGKNDDWITVIGVVGNARRQGIEQASTPHVFLWQAQSQAEGGPAEDWVIRTTIRPAALAGSVRAAVRRIEPRAVITNLMPLEQQVELQTTERKFQTWLLAIFAALALVLAAVGIFGVTSYSVARRTREIGIRMALGADRMGVLGMIAWQSVGYAALGLGAGIFVAMEVTSILGSLLYGVKPTDPAAFVSAGLLLLTVAAAATWAPAWRASRVDPAVALRQD
jgi:predicted permease